jgi:hypothetical protein
MCGCGCGAVRCGAVRYSAAQCGTMPRSYAIQHGNRLVRVTWQHSPHSSMMRPMVGVTERGLWNMKAVVGSCELAAGSSWRQGVGSWVGSWVLTSWHWQLGVGRWEMGDGRWAQREASVDGATAGMLTSDGHVDDIRSTAAAVVSRVLVTVGCSTVWQTIKLQQRPCWFVAFGPLRRQRGRERTRL